ncbi:uncharacterized protein MONBRDRAFT_6572 [Monosiga brevicollis MX1]|uniref:TNFR-Cys domain-containing protein n=1 Tax=Monosiga brevicollis TaxID=81824 RepID=A9UUA1_MONBE|nr:uncharacterized protein MONBRDRAFT_6572 [Monosiga brevicollis MX1]EDQ91387.1 predicted protein [Monosiga brevicollis MX1]|eukprot:XP_001743809.1 hypothetical protein [Monosiga brevicollis MX1]
MALLGGLLLLSPAQAIGVQGLSASSPLYFQNYSVSVVLQGGLSQEVAGTNLATRLIRLVCMCLVASTAQPHVVILPLDVVFDKVVEVIISFSNYTVPSSPTALIGVELYGDGVICHDFGLDAAGTYATNNTYQVPANWSITTDDTTISVGVGDVVWNSRTIQALTVDNLGASETLDLVLSDLAPAIRFAGDGPVVWQTLLLLRSIARELRPVRIGARRLLFASGAHFFYTVAHEPMSPHCFLPVALCNSCRDHPRAALDCNNTGTYFNTSLGLCLNCDGSTNYQDEVNQTACKPMTTCTLAQYQSVPGQSTADRSCAALLNCTSEQYESESPTVTSNRACADLEHCGAGSYVSVAATATSDRECAACVGGYSVAANAGSCTAFSNCSSGTEYASFSGNATADRLCAAVTVCRESEYESLAPTPTTDRLCMAVQNCSAGFYISVVATATSDRTCARCEICSDGETARYDCGPTSERDSECMACPENCDACTYESEGDVVVCTECAIGIDAYPNGTCPGACPADYVADFTPCFACGESCYTCDLAGCLSCFNNASRVPNNGRSIPADPAQYTYLATGSACVSTCPNGQFANMGTGRCQSIRTCGAGTYVVASPTSTSDRECAPCLGGTFSTAVNQPIETCVPCPAGSTDADNDPTTPCKVCGGGRYLDPSVLRTEGCDAYLCAAGTTDDDGNVSTACVACSAGTYLNAATERVGPCSAFACALGATDDDSNVSTPCVTCSEGAFLDPSEVRTGPCSDYACGAGTTDADANVSTPCVTCDPGTFLAVDEVHVGPCTKTSSSSGGSAVIIGAAAGGVAFIVIVVVVVCCCCGSGALAKRGKDKPSGNDLTMHQNQMFSAGDRRNRHIRKSMISQTLRMAEPMEAETDPCVHFNLTTLVGPHKNCHVHRAESVLELIVLHRT